MFPKRDLSNLETLLIDFIVKHKLKKPWHASDRFDSQNYFSFSCAERYVSLIQAVISIL